MLIYEKKVLGERHLFASESGIPSVSDDQLVYKDVTGTTITPTLSDGPFLDDGKGGIVDKDGTFIAVYADSENIIPGNGWTPVTIDHLEIVSQPTNLWYSYTESPETGDCGVNKELDTTGLLVKAVYTDGSSKIIPNNQLGFCDSQGGYDDCVSAEGFWGTYYPTDLLADGNGIKVYCFENTEKYAILDSLILCSLENTLTITPPSFNSYVIENGAIVPGSLNTEGMVVTATVDTATNLKGETVTSQAPSYITNVTDAVICDPTDLSDEASSVVNNKLEISVYLAFPPGDEAIQAATGSFEISVENHDL